MILTKAKSKIFEAVHETAEDFYQLGFIDKDKMEKFDILCLEQIPEKANIESSTFQSQRVTQSLE